MEKNVLVNQTSGFLVVDDLLIRRLILVKYVDTIGQVAQREWQLDSWHSRRYSSSYSSSIEIVT